MIEEKDAQKFADTYFNKLDVIDNNALIDKIIMCGHENWTEIITKTIIEIGVKTEFLFSDTVKLDKCLHITPYKHLNIFP